MTRSNSWLSVVLALATHDVLVKTIKQMMCVHRCGASLSYSNKLVHASNFKGRSSRDIKKRSTTRRLPSTCSELLLPATEVKPGWKEQMFTGELGAVIECYGLA